MKTTWLTLLLPGLVFGATGQAEFHVSPGGDDAATGSVAAPFATLNHALAASRQLPPGGAREIVVHGGAFYNVGLLLTPRDSGLTLTAASGEHPVLYGGRPITGWRKQTNGWLTADLPPLAMKEADVAAGLALADWQVRRLLVNGEPRPRARFPAEGRLKHESRFDVRWMSSTGGGWQRKPTHAELTTLRYRPGDLPADLEVRNAEITVYHMWDESVVGLKAVDRGNHTLHFASPTGHPPGAFGVREYVLWNLRAGLTRPGQWYHDRVRGRLVYWPLPGEQPDSLHVIAPTHTTILRLRGKAGRPVRDVTVRGLTFSATTVPLVAAGFGAARFDGAINLEAVEHCRFEKLTIRGVAGQGINGHRGVRDVTITDCEVADCGAGGIYVGGERVTIANNHVHGIGQSFPAAIGIFRGGRHAAVVHNEVHDCTYSAINYGGVGNVIASNLLYHCMTELHDGAAIYLFAATNCVLRGNVARDIPDTGGYGSSAYYLDERSRRCVVEDNLSLNVARPLHMHMATNNVVRHNVFIVDGDARLTFPRCEQFTMEGNLLLATGGIRVENVGAITQWRDNVFFAGNGQLEFWRQKNYQNRDRLPAPPGGITVADPGFRDWKAGDFRYRADSPARALGLPEHDWSTAGRRKTPSR